MTQRAQAQAQAAKIRADFINAVAPLLIERLKQGFKVKTTDGQFYKKDQNDIYAILKKFAVTNVRCHIRISEFNISLDVSNHVACGEPDKWGYTQSVNGQDYVYLWDFNKDEPFDFEPLEPVTSDEIEAAIIELAKVEEQLSDLERRKSQLKRIIQA